MPEYELTIGEFLPADDRVAQWVFGVTTLCEDLVVLVEPLKAAEAQSDVRGMLVLYRLLMMRLHEPSGDGHHPVR